MKKRVLCTASILGAFALSGAIVTSPSGNEGKGQEGIQKSADRNHNTKWFSEFNRGLSWQLELPVARFLQSYSFVYSNDEPARDPKSWIVEGSADGKTFTKIAEEKDVKFDSRLQEKEFSIASSGSYRFYRIVFTGLAAGNDGFQIAEIEFK